ncbi:hypothetical protein OUZ56_007698 [Daphnia magna]|uniref:Uncharacterized protein n=1 Tax=Daphnia magna TaxID=35525 RepID=A0ABR0AAR0_9CRUS|nr:hypothetical protein OUZ56_007698 [Daphnia magna]
MYQRLLIMMAWLFGNEPEYILPMYYTANQREEMAIMAQPNGTSEPPDNGHHQPPDERTNNSNGEFTNIQNRLLITAFNVIQGMLMVISRIQTHPGPHPDPDQTSTRTEHPERRRLNGTSQPPDTGHRQPPDERTNQDHGEFKVDTKDGIRYEPNSNIVVLSLKLMQVTLLRVSYIFEVTLLKWRRDI